MKPFFKLALLYVTTFILLVVAAYAGMKVHYLSRLHGKIRNDYSMVNNITNGILSIDVWKKHVVVIVDKEIENFQLTAEQKKTLKSEIEQVLESVIDKAYAQVEQKQHTLKGKVEKFAAHTLLKKGDVEKLVPGYSETILKTLTSHSSKEKMETLAETKMKELGAETHDDTTNATAIHNILQGYHVGSIPAFNHKTKILTNNIRRSTFHFTYILLGITGGFLLLWFLLRNEQKMHTPFFIISVLLALVLLAVGLTAPMIEIDARIKSLNFFLLGDKISFTDQVVFFQSKSIVDVVHLLLITKKYDSVFVGLLILVFSIVFPFAKLISAGMFLLGKDRWRDNKFIKFFAFKSGKWSMADVMVIAIFMAYIGFQGILDNQMQNMNVKSDAFTSLGTNQTSLQPGYIVFIIFVLFGLVLSYILDWITKKEENAQTSKV